MKEWDSQRWGSCDCFGVLCVIMAVSIINRIPLLCDMWWTHTRANILVIISLYLPPVDDTLSLGRTASAQKPEIFRINCVPLLYHNSETDHVWWKKNEVWGRSSDDVSLAAGVTHTAAVTQPDHNKKLELNLILSRSWLEFLIFYLIPDLNCKM